MSRLLLVFTVVVVSFPAAARANYIDFESLQVNELVRDQFTSQGLTVTGTGSFSGRVYTIGMYEVAPFGNSGTHIMDIGGYGESTTFSFSPPLASVSFLMGDGDPDEETFLIEFRGPAGQLLRSENLGTVAQGLTIVETSQSLGSTISTVTLTLDLNSHSGVVLDDLHFQAASPAVPALGHGWTFLLAATLLAVGRISGRRA